MTGIIVWAHLKLSEIRINFVKIIPKLKQIKNSMDMHLGEKTNHIRASHTNTACNSKFTQLTQPTTQLSFFSLNTKM